jgi:subtilisin family serine protease
MQRLALIGTGLALAVPGIATAGSFAVGVRPGASLDRVVARASAVSGASVSSDRDLRAVYVNTGNRAALARIPGISYVERLSSRRLAFFPNDPLIVRQWYLSQIHAFDFWQALPPLPPIKVAVIDSGIDAGHPEFEETLLAWKSFVKSKATKDTQGHGTFVAGEIAAGTNNGIGISGIAFPVQLLVAKVVRSDGTIPIKAEASAIRWAVDQGARVINLSLAGLRDPLAKRRDTYSPLEAAAIRYAVRKHVLVVAAVGNSDQAPRSPWNFAGYPAALPHVVGVSALEPSGAIPEFSNRDAFYNDVSAPGVEIFSTVPQALTASTRGACVNQGYSDCGPFEFRHAEGTSFAAPMVTAAAALVLSVRPGLVSDQVSWIVERSADDVNSNTGCRSCPLGHDRLSGSGRVDVTSAAAFATAGPYPRSDTREPNDDAGTVAPKIWTRGAGTINATVDYWDDPVDVYRIRLRKDQLLSLALNGPQGANSNLSLWRPGTQTVGDLSPAAQRMRVAQSLRAGSSERIRAFRAKSGGWYYIEVKLSSKDYGPYSLAYSRG